MSSNSKKITVAVGMSGGVDSSVAAYLLKQSGYDVVGLFMKNWEEKDERGVCQSTQDYEDVVRVCSQLDIPFYSVNFVQEYQNEVFAQFLQELQKGHTPNPDILCNRQIKFHHFLRKALHDVQADYLATGHYCRIALADNRWYLLRGKDAHKDQSYFVYTLKESILPKILFPIGHLTKPQVRHIAKEQNLATAEKKDSTGICFIGKRDFKEFVSRYLPCKQGEFQTLDGAVVGKHAGAHLYTIGQRKGLGIGGKGQAWFVAGKDMEKNVVYVVQGENHPALFYSGLYAVDLSWIGPAPSMPFKCVAKIRYRSEDASARIEMISDDRIKVCFDTPQKSITPRQSIVFYDDDICLGGAMIEKGFCS